MRLRLAALAPTVVAVAAASLAIGTLREVPPWATVAAAAAWVACFWGDALYTLGCGRAAILARESNAVFKALYARLGAWAAPAHMALEASCAAALSASLAAAGLADGLVAASAALAVLACEHAVAIAENMALARRARGSAATGATT